MSETLFHLAEAEHWMAAVDNGVYARSTAGRELDEVGFIHCSYHHQLSRIVDSMFRDRDDVVLLAIDPASVPAEIRVENLEGGEELFPHIYGPLPVAAVVTAVALPTGPDGRVNSEHLDDAIHRSGVVETE